MLNIFYKVNCKSNFVIYQLECYVCKMQYASKSETPFNIRLYNHRKDIKSPNAILACKDFNKHNHGFNNHRKLMITEQLRNITISFKTLEERPNQQENF